MAEYGKLKQDGRRVYLGSCEDMWNVRFEDRDKLEPLENNQDVAGDAWGLRFRVPFPDEDGVMPGDYKELKRGARLTDLNGMTFDCVHQARLLEDVGGIQLRHEASGLLLNVPCHHGLKLPEVQTPIRAFWNGKGHALELVAIKAHQEEDGRRRVMPVIGCRFCGHKWRFEWLDVICYIMDHRLLNNLLQYMDAEDKELSGRLTDCLRRKG